MLGWWEAADKVSDLTGDLEEEVEVSLETCNFIKRLLSARTSDPQQIARTWKRSSKISSKNMSLSWLKLLPHLVGTVSQLKDVPKGLALSWWPVDGGDTVGQAALKSHQASSLQGQPQLRFHDLSDCESWNRPSLACSEGHSALQPPASPPTVFFRQMHQGITFNSRPLPLFSPLPYPCYPLAFLLLSLFHFMNHDTNFNPR